MEWWPRFKAVARPKCAFGESNSQQTQKLQHWPHQNCSICKAPHNRTVAAARCHCRTHTRAHPHTHTHARTRTHTHARTRTCTHTYFLPEHGYGPNMDVGSNTDVAHSSREMEWPRRYPRNARPFLPCRFEQSVSTTKTGPESNLCRATCLQFSVFRSPFCFLHFLSFFHFPFFSLCLVFCFFFSVFNFIFRISNHFSFLLSLSCFLPFFHSFHFRFHFHVFRKLHFLHLHFFISVDKL